MRRPTSLVVDTTLDDTTSSTTSSPDASTTKFPVSADSSAHKVGNVPRSPQYSPPSPPEPSIRLLFSLISRRHFFILLLPALLSSIFAGGIAPFMTLVVGQVFDALSKFPVDPNPPEAAKKQLLHDVGMTAIELVALAIGALALSSLTSCLWIWTGERNLRAVRKEVYTAVTRKDMIWFDTKMGEENSVQTAEGDGPVGAGGLMAKFARDTDDVRMASSLASGMLVQYLTTTITCLILAFIRSWSLTLVILSALPAMVLIQSLSQAFVGPNLNNERTHTATAATLVDHAVSAISTVKAFNAELHEAETIGVVLDKLQSAANKCIAIWGITGTFAQFVMMAMFVQGFWFGSKLVREGKNSVGDVTTVFWACLIASSNLQMCIPQFIIFAKGKFAMAALVALMESTAAPPDDHHGPTVHTPLYKRSRRTTELRKIIPSSCSGGLELIDVTFAYPSRPTMPVLSNVSVFLPAGETTFIVGGSGSGKSTIAQLLLRMYNLQEGMIRLDEQDVAYLDSNWTRQHISAVSQNCILFDMTVHDNVAMGLAGPGSSRRPEDVTREEVVAVCRAALMHEFVRDLPDGYDTKLGNGGANLSGGQKQRLAIARALLRNPTVLILDEATSALDATSRLLVFEAIKAWRRNMTTVVITHDLSQITSEDFVYVLRSGALVEQGFREDLEQCSDGEFFHMAHMQDISGGFLPEESPRDFKSAPLDAILEQQEVEKDKELEAAGFNRLTIKHQSIYRPLTMGNWMLDAVADLTKPTAAADIPALSVPHQAHPTNRYFPDEVISPKTPKENRFSLHVDIPITPAPVAISGAANRRYSLPFTPASPTSKFSFPESTLVDEDETMEEKYGYERVARRVTQRRMTDASIKKPVRAKWDEKTLSALRSVKVEPSEPEEKKDVVPIEPQVSFWRLMKDIYPTVPHKPLIVFGLFMSLASGAMTPIFSYLFSRLLYEVSIGAQNVRLINTYGGIVLTVAALDGIVYGLKYVVMEYAAMKWVTKIRKTCLQLVFSQDKKWFDKTENSSVRLMQIIIKDGDDARTLIATVLSQLFVVAAMLGIGLIWALIIGWQLTLMGIAIAPVFAIAMTVQTNLVSKCEVRNKRAREDVAKGYYDAISNVRGIRAMGFETAFQDKFDKSVDEALTTGVRGAFVEGCTYGVASALIYLAEALIFYVGAVLIAHGTYDYLRMIQVLNLVVFTVSIGSQLMAFTQRIAKSVQATRDFNTLLKLTTDTDESRGTLRPPVVGNVSFNHINFSYPERPDVPVLKDFSVEVGDSECVAIVGSSGSGKSTMASLLQRLYEPASGSITIGYNDIALADAHHLRNHISVVSQQPNLFDCTIAENIAYGNKSLSEADIRAAAQAAHVHDFIMTLPKGYETHVGENASLISGGQAQRLQIARALARPAKILILDECTSALDPQNQAAVMEAIMDVKAGRTTIMVTHKLPVMRMCDRILVVHEGAIVEEGTYEDLMQRRGVFAQLASGGEWMD